jgi:hypothetical protein
VVVAALAISIISAAGAVGAFVVAWVSIGISRRAARAAEASAAEARRSAIADEGIHQIERERQYEERRPVLEGRVVPLPYQRDDFRYQLEVWVKTPEPLMWITLTVPPNSGFYRGSHLMRFDLWYPLGEHRRAIKTREVLSWPVSLSGAVRGTVVVTARCRTENAIYYEGIEVPIDLDTAERDQILAKQLAEAQAREASERRQLVEDVNVLFAGKTGYVVNDSGRSLSDITCKVMSRTGRHGVATAQACGEVVPGAGGQGWMFLPGAEKTSRLERLRPGSRGGFSFDVAGSEPDRVLVVWFTDNDGFRWQLDEYQHFVQSDDESQYLPLMHPAPDAIGSGG